MTKLSIKAYNKILRAIALVMVIAFSAESCLLATPVAQERSALRPVRKVEQSELSNVSPKLQGFPAPVNAAAPGLARANEGQNTAKGVNIDEFHEAADGVVRDKEKVILLKGEKSVYTPRFEEGEKALTQAEYDDKQPAKLREAIVWLAGQDGFGERAMRLAQEATIIGIYTDTPYIIAGADGQNGFYYQASGVGRDRKAIYIPIPLIDRLGREELAALLNHEQIEMDSHYSLTGQGIKKDDEKRYKTQMGFAHVMAEQQEEQLTGSGICGSSLDDAIVNLVFRDWVSREGAVVLFGRMQSTLENMRNTATAEDAMDPAKRGEIEARRNRLISGILTFVEYEFPDSFLRFSTELLRDDEIVRLRSYTTREVRGALTGLLEECRMHSAVENQRLSWAQGSRIKEVSSAVENAQEIYEVFTKSRRQSELHIDKDFEIQNTPVVVKNSFPVATGNVFSHARLINGYSLYGFVSSDSPNFTFYVSPDTRHIRCLAYEKDHPDRRMHREVEAVWGEQNYQEPGKVPHTILLDFLFTQLTIMRETCLESDILVEDAQSAFAGMIETVYSDIFNDWFVNCGKPFIEQSDARELKDPQAIFKYCLLRETLTKIGIDNVALAEGVRWSEVEQQLAHPACDVNTNQNQLSEVLKAPRLRVKRGPKPRTARLVLAEPDYIDELTERFGIEGPWDNRDEAIAAIIRHIFSLAIQGENPEEDVPEAARRMSEVIRILPKKAYEDRRAWARYFRIGFVESRRRPSEFMRAYDFIDALCLLENSNIAGFFGFLRFSVSEENLSESLRFISTVVERLVVVTGEEELLPSGTAKLKVLSKELSVTGGKLHSAIITGLFTNSSVSVEKLKLVVSEESVRQSVKSMSAEIERAINSMDETDEMGKVSKSAARNKFETLLGAQRETAAEDVADAKPADTTVKNGGGEIDEGA